MRYELRNIGNGTIHMHVIDGDLNIGLVSIKLAYFDQWAQKATDASDEARKAFAAGNMKHLAAV